MDKKVVFCVAIETQDSGSVDWFRFESNAFKAYLEAVTNSDNVGATVTRFNLRVDVAMDDDGITNEVDFAMWKVHSLDRRIGLDGLSITSSFCDEVMA